MPHLQCGMAKLRHELRRKRDAIELALFTGAPVARRRGAPRPRGHRRSRSAATSRAASTSWPRPPTARRGAPTIATARRAPACAASPPPGGATIYLMAVETFPDHVNNVYLDPRGGHAPRSTTAARRPRVARGSRARADACCAKVYDEPRSGSTTSATSSSATRTSITSAASAPTKRAGAASTFTSSTRAWSRASRSASSSRR